LNEQLTGGRPPEVLAIEGKKDSNEKMVAHLNVQVYAINDCLITFKYAI